MVGWALDHPGGGGQRCVSCCLQLQVPGTKCRELRAEQHMDSSLCQRLEPHRGSLQPSLGTPVSVADAETETLVAWHRGQ